MRLSLVCLALVAGVAAGCVGDQHREARALAEAHQQCVAERSASDPECEALHQRKLDAQRRYQEQSRRAWGCDPAQETCPTPR